MMPLSCDCSYEAGPGETIYFSPDDFSVYKKARRTRCASCRTLIAHGDSVAEFDRYKVPETEVECTIYGDDGTIPRAPKYLCERCAGLYFSLDDLGFCVDPDESMEELIHEYHHEYGPEEKP